MQRGSLYREEFKLRSQVSRSGARLPRCRLLKKVAKRTYFHARRYSQYLECVIEASWHAYNLIILNQTCDSFLNGLPIPLLFGHQLLRLRKFLFADIKGAKGCCAVFNWPSIELKLQASLSFLGINQ